MQFDWVNHRMVVGNPQPAPPMSGADVSTEIVVALGTAKGFRRKLNSCTFEDSSGSSSDMSAATSALLVATSAALVTLGVITAYQLGLLDHLPDPPLTIFDSDKITDSPLAHPSGVPDGLLGIASYSATLGLVLLARERSLPRKLLAMKLIADGAVAGVNTARQIISFRKLCSWCSATALCTAVMVVAGRRLIASELSRL